MKLPDGIKRVAFDFDGTIGDTIPLHLSAIRKAFEGLGILIDDNIHQEARLHGITSFEVMPWIIRELGLEISDAKMQDLIELKRQIFRDLVANESTLMKNIDKLIEISHSKFGSLIVVTAEDRIPVEGALSRHGLYGKFNLSKSVADHDVTEDEAKPKPYPYLLAAKRLRVDPENILVFEDSLHGIKSAKDAGCYVVGLTTMHGKEYLDQHSTADIILDVADAIEMISNT
jgi:beta-phosphoglucomutase